MEWLIAELDLDYVASSLLPELLQHHLSGGEKLDYHVQIVARDDPSMIIYDSESGSNMLDSYRPGAARSANSHSDASVGLFEVQYDQIRRRGEGPPGDRPRMAPPPNPDRSRWLLSVRHRAGSLEMTAAKWYHWPGWTRPLAVTRAVWPTPTLSAEVAAMCKKPALLT